MTVAGVDCMMGDGVSCSLPLAPEDEKRIIGGLKKMGEDNLKEGDLWFVLSIGWWRYWVRYVGFDGDDTQSSGSKPGEIDNSHLVSGETAGNGHFDLHRSLQEGQNYVLVPEDVWNKLIEWYNGGPAIRRRVILQEVGSQKNLVVEVYPLCLHLVVSDTNKLVLWMSKKDTVGKLYEQVSQRLNRNSSEILLLDYFEKSRTALEDRDRTLEDSQLQMDQDVLVELKESHAADNSSASYSNQLALVPVEPPRSPVSIAGGPSCNGVLSGFGSDASHRNNSISIRNDAGDGYDSSSTSTSGSGAGITGLQNLGNTCFMNSAVQCLVHTPPLVEFFVGDYSKEINRQNPLGMDGELALAFGELLRKLWSSGRTPIAPRAFKGKLAHFAPQFSGYNQHDSQELLAFLLDGLHEDLNRVRQKPYIETKEANERPDDEVADEFWANHKARNDSVIVDICQGQYKSTLVCPDCSKVSVTFDPFMYLSLPLPSLAIRSMTISVFYGDGSQLPVAFTISVPRMGYCSDLLRALRDACCLRGDEDLVLAEVLDHKIYKYFDHPYEALSSIRDEDYLVAFRFPKVQMNSPRLEITHKRNEIDRFDIQKTLRLKLFGTPLITFLPEGLDSPNDIQNAVTTVLSPLLRDKDRAVQNSSSMEEDVISADNSEPANGCMDQSVSDANQESTSDGGRQFALFITGHGSVKPVSKEAVSCLHGSSKIKVFMHWSDEDLDSYDVSFLENLPEVFKPGSVVKKTRQESVTLFSCLEAFLKEEPLGPDDKWYCPVCKEHQQATKKLDLWRLPEILVVHLKRFSFNRYMKTKLDTFVDFPVSNLDLTKYGRQNGLPQSQIYDLYAISNHYGGMGGGHYTAYVKLIDQNQWYSFDDSHVSPVSENEIKTSAAYVLFYRRVNREAGAQGRHSLSNNQTRRSA